MIKHMFINLILNFLWQQMALITIIKWYEFNTGANYLSFGQIYVYIQEHWTQDCR